MVRTFLIATGSIVVLYIVAALVVGLLHPFDMGYSARVYADDTSTMPNRNVTVVQDNDNDWLLWWMVWNSGGGGCYNCGSYGVHYYGGGSFSYGYGSRAVIQHTTINKNTYISNHTTINNNRVVNNKTQPKNNNVSPNKPGGGGGSKPQPPRPPSPRPPSPPSPRGRR